jgi:hypothetical protein
MRLTALTKDETDDMQITVDDVYLIAMEVCQSCSDIDYLFTS